MIKLDTKHKDIDGELTHDSFKELEHILDNYHSMLECGLDSQEDIINFILSNFEV